MSGIYIPNMEMPKSCITGKLPYYEYCPFFGGCSKRASAKTERPSNCPLKEVPTHGRLVDADYVKKIIRNDVSSDCDECVGYTCGLIDEMPTVLEASTEERE